jgi:hypothetical protein
MLLCSHPEKCAHLATFPANCADCWYKVCRGSDRFIPMWARQWIEDNEK